MAAPFTIAHVTDPHLAPLPTPPLRSLLGKRLLGYLSWKRRRHRIHRSEVLKVLETDLERLAVDQIVVTGDITNISLPDEFSAAAEWLANIGTPDRVTVVPGNHDHYVRLRWEETWAKWQHFMAGDGPEGPRPPAGFGDFPFVRHRGPTAIVGVSTACPSPPGFATGTLGSLQLRRLDQVLEELRQSGRCRVLLLHHPIKSAVKWRKRLTDARALSQVLERHGVELVLHGHDHRFVEETLPGPDGPIPVLGIPSASAAIGDKSHPSAHYTVIDIRQTGSEWELTVKQRAFSHTEQTFGQVRELRYALPRKEQPAGVRDTVP
jgi:3',5'-cyclic AMP phosphodiesterase CpdA